MTRLMDEERYLREYVMLSDLNSEIWFLEKFLKEHGFTEELEDMLYDQGASPRIVRTLLLVNDARERAKVVRAIEEIAPVSLALTRRVRMDPYNYIANLTPVTNPPDTCFNAKITRRNTTISELMDYLVYCCIKMPSVRFLNIIKFILSEDDPVRKLVQAIHNRNLIETETKAELLMHTTVLSAAEETGFMEEYCESIRKTFGLEVSNTNRLITSIK